jgi:hypothetical protein
MENESTKQVRQNSRKRAGGAPPGNKNNLVHGLYSYKAMLNGKGLDQRTSLFNALREKEQELVSALNGDPSPQQQAIIGDSVKNMLYIASLDGAEVTCTQRPSAPRIIDPDPLIRSPARELEDPRAKARG